MDPLVAVGRAYVDRVVSEAWAEDAAECCEGHPCCAAWLRGPCSIAVAAVVGRHEAAHAAAEEQVARLRVPSSRGRLLVESVVAGAGRYDVRRCTDGAVLGQVRWLPLAERADHTRPWLLVDPLVPGAKGIPFASCREALAYVDAALRLGPGGRS